MHVENLDKESDRSAQLSSENKQLGESVRCVVSAWGVPVCACACTYVCCFWMRVFLCMLDAYSM